MPDQPVVCICGGGNGAHVIACFAAAHARPLEVRVLTLYGDEAAVWREKLAEGDLVVARHHPDGSVEEIKARPSLVTKDAGKAVTGADVIIFCVPAFVHSQYFEAIGPHVGDCVTVIGLPGQPGFELQCLRSLRERGKGCAILNYETLPWPCRIAEFGRKVDLLGTKETVAGSSLSSASAAAGSPPGDGDPARLLQSIVGPRPALSQAHSWVEMILMSHAFLHPALMYGQWAHWDGRPLSRPPLFYQELTESAASVMRTASQEVINIARAISEAKPEVTMTGVESLESWLLRNYSSTIRDPTSLRTAMRSNSAYDGLLHPMTEVSPGQFVPDFQHRYLSENVPFGLAVVKGVAQIAGVATPCIDEVLTWAQGHLGKEFIVGSELKGKDVKDTRAPQAFGLNSLEDLLDIV